MIIHNFSNTDIPHSVKHYGEISHVEPTEEGYTIEQQLAMGKVTQWSLKGSVAVVGDRQVVNKFMQSGVIYALVLPEELTRLIKESEQLHELLAVKKAEQVSIAALAEPTSPVEAAASEKEPLPPNTFRNSSIGILRRFA
ncbi:hypothetical protein [Anabaena catenula]|uniref:Uncharacterized protein n=1 Tax=Anabaena catenula FACHB-362 TaxID=2692877 RepID=A0ABR8JBN5_9NOST|nr:hypothetical protein [Anabaena catenula]MBD2694441.1 hypothetical protein [Anabaena catenula FACHB-362]